MYRYPSIVMTVALATGVTSAALAQKEAPKAMGEMTAVSASTVTFEPLEVPGFDSGMKIAVVNGDPNGSGTYTLRLSFPAGYKFPPHFHPMAENLTVLTGTLLLAMGEMRDEAKLTAYEAGSFLHIPSPQPHYGGARGATVVQLHGQGPFKVILANEQAASH